MSHRHATSDADFRPIEHFLPGQHGVARDHRRSLDAFLWIARTGAVWADLPERPWRCQQPAAAVRPRGR